MATGARTETAAGLWPVFADAFKPSKLAILGCSHPRRRLHCVQGRFMAVDFASDMQQELNYFAGPRGLGVDGFYTDCTHTTSEWRALMCVLHQHTCVMRLPWQVDLQSASLRHAPAQMV